jgi:hypothetical protein
MDSFIPPLPQKATAREGVLYHQRTFRWRVFPPKLPNGVERVPRDGNLEIYKRGKEMFVAIQRKEQLPEASKLAADLSAKVVAKNHS